jgi:FlaA1/EpsC-like NDP-sugar epimerase
LVIQAGAIGNGGEVFVLDMGEPVRIVELAENLIRLSRLVPGKDIPIVFTGVRAGEKLFEELLSKEEGTTATRHERIFIAVLPNGIRKDLISYLDSIEQLLNKGELHVESWLGDMIEDYRPIRVSEKEVASTID